MPRRRRASPLWMGELTSETARLHQRFAGIFAAAIPEAKRAALRSDVSADPQW